MRVARIVLLAAVSLVFGCAGPAQKTLANDLYFAASSMERELLDMDEVMADAIDTGDAAAIEAIILRGDELLRDWRKRSERASGSVGKAADLYAESLVLRISMYEAASRAARYRSVEDSREAVRLQVDAYDKAQQALDRLFDIAN